MAIRLITGVPGAGKSYYMVNHLADKYCKKFGDTFTLKKNYIIITNIENLLLDVVDLDEAIKRAGSLELFFSSDVQKKVAKKYQDEGKRLVYIIDECQQYFHRRYYDRVVFSFFESHRHFGLDIYLVSQNSNLVAKDLIALIEYEVRAVPRTLALGGRFNYLKKSNKDIIGREFLKKRKTVFNLYKSMQAGETEKIRTPYLKYCIPIIVLLIFGFYGLSQSFVGRSVRKSDVSDTSSLKNSERSSKSVQAVKNNSSIPFVPVSYVRKGSSVSVRDSNTQALCPVSMFPYELKAVLSGSAIRLYARMPSLDIEKKEN